MVNTFRIIMALALVLGLALWMWMVQDTPESTVILKPIQSAKVTSTPVPIVVLAQSKPMLASAAPVPQVSHERCETTLVRGSHTSRVESEARQGALEDAADICPAGTVTPGSLSCEQVDGERGVMGYSALRCIQEGSCTLCGDKLTRKYEINQ